MKIVITGSNGIIGSAVFKYLNSAIPTKNSTYIDTEKDLNKSKDNQQLLDFDLDSDQNSDQNTDQYSKLTDPPAKYTVIGCVRSLSDDNTDYNTDDNADNNTDDNNPNEHHIAVGNIHENTDWSLALQDADIVIHTAATVHQMQGTADYHTVNYLGTLRLANQAVQAGVKRFIFLSSIKAMGESGHFHPLDPCRPEDEYGQSKLAAEIALQELAKQSGMEVVILRLTLVYGPGIKANFLNLMQWVDAKRPLPFKNIQNARSFLGLDNLTHLIELCIHHPRAANQIFLPSDVKPISSSELIEQIYQAFDTFKIQNYQKAASAGKVSNTLEARPIAQSPRLFALPGFISKHFIQGVLKIIGKSKVYDRIYGSLTVDSHHLEETLAWHPPFTMQEQLLSTVKWYKNHFDAKDGAHNLSSQLSSILAPHSPYKLPQRGFKRLFDLSLVIAAIPFLVIPLLLTAFAVRGTSKGPILYWSKRVGKNNQIFQMPKFRSMSIDTPILATHLLDNPKAWLTPIGSFLRKTSLDELPQLWSIFSGDMSFVGPRPALYNQEDLISLRTECGVHQLVPGLTGWAQINGRDELPIPDKVRLDVEYLERQSFFFDINILIKTLLKVLRRDGVVH